MRNSDGQFREIVDRAAALRERRSARKAVAGWALSSAACVALLITAALCLPLRLDGNSVTVSGQYGSLLLSASGMGYVAIGVLAFLLGVCVTLLAIHVRWMRDRERDGK